MMEGMDDSLLRGDKLMAKELFEAAMSNDDEFIDNDDEYLLRKTFVSNNILHIAIKYQSDDEGPDFARKAASRFPHLISERNFDGNTPLHFAAELNEFHVDILRELCEKLTDLKPLRIKNSIGNTALHVAVIHNRLEAADILVEKDPYLVEIVNDSMEAPLHLALKHFPDFESPDGVRQTFKRLMAQKGTDLEELHGTAPTKEETMGMMIGLLLGKASYIAGWRDASGLTPLHIAASLPTSYNLKVIDFIIKCCPTSIEVCDAAGKSILHHLINRIDFLQQEATEFLDNTHMRGLANHRDQQGNTPAHLSAIENDLDMLEQLGLSLELNGLLKNKQGVTLKKLMTIVRDKFFREGYTMREEIRRAAECGDLFTLGAYVQGQNALGSRDSNRRSLIAKLFLIKSGHIIIPERFFGFIESIIHYVGMDKDGDKDGDTPLHILAQLNPDNIMIHCATKGPHSDNPTPEENLYPGPKPNDPIFFNSYYQLYTYIWESLGRTSFFSDLIDYAVKFFSSDERELLKQNVKGNTILHEALIAKNDLAFIKFAKLNKGATTLVNNRNETLLHLLAARIPTPSVPEEIMDNIIKNNTEDKKRNLLDEDGQSPLMVAIKASNFAFAAKLCSVCPWLAEVRGHNGETFWHLLVDVPTSSFDFANTSLAQEGVRRSLEIKDKDENTALHLAIERRRFDLARLFLSLPFDGTRNFNTRLLGIPNKEGNTPGHMIGSLPYLPPEFEKFIWKDSTMIGTRSMWGVPTTQMKDYVNTMGVIAALLTTITFTAAFTVPGGLNQEEGTPLLVKDRAFQVFIISDVLAMCLSMMVLFCLLWIMATGDKSRSVVLLDFSIILLLASFYTTMLTFMTGIYATFHLVKPWIAIFSLVPCSMLFLLTHKYLVIKLIIPFGKLILIFVDKAYHSTKEAFQYAYGLSKSCISIIKTCCSWSSSPMPMSQSQDGHAV